VNAQEEGSGISREKLQKFFPKFGDWFVSRFYDEWIKAPSTVAELQVLEKPYRLAGVPGTVCSQDAVHVAWDRCPSSLRADHTGKENYPTLAWNFCVAHTTKILSIHGHKHLPGAPHTDWEGDFKGATNDKTIVRTDILVHAIGTGDIYVNFRYNVYTSDDYDTMEMRGAHCINDGGYHNWVHTIEGTKEGYAATAAEERWGGIMESLRKDSERCFGILKKRFRILSLPFLLHKAKSIDTIMKVIARLS